ncbi:maleylpyruvate isomerase family mycothiol-dependent enzyme [Streptomyces sp. TRM66268-LWL]|uniref:Maleylpyruvate isomerase family mycothiol-dependent enzyme n=1 Tax=Streptomyces polyasparticus TaxID=2767826 RepID=A0ABR7SLX3_9ACTN|nr:maleylpyruvate isomerase family mycothiol-dependent enzyme [Streptomyces polyasparticus]MBC9715997.1 maleylpyruvate isomerase family mycothiol-dependent enzyme [Streptomyces polyasparticus]
MDIAEHIAILRAEGRLLADSAESAGPDAAVATCPGWQVRDLLKHTGAVHRWATGYVVQKHTERRPLGEAPDLDGDALVGWFREGHGLLVEALEQAPDDLECWAFLPAPSPRAFWARRQAHETAVHRVDSDSALRPGAYQGIGSAFAADGIDELLTGFHARERSRVRSEEPKVLRVRTTDEDAVWTVRITDKPPATTPGEEGEADCEISGPAAQLYLALWNRLPLPQATGDAAVARLWQETSAV